MNKIIHIYLLHFSLFTGINPHSFYYFTKENMSRTRTPPPIPLEYGTKGGIRICKRY